VTSIVFMSSRCAPDLPELVTLRQQLVGKYGQEFGQACCSEDRAAAVGVNERLLQLMAIAAPPPAIKLARLQVVATEHGVAWDEAAAQGSILSQAAPDPPPPRGAEAYAWGDSGVAGPPLPPSPQESPRPAAPRPARAPGPASGDGQYSNAADAANAAQRAADLAVAAAAAAQRLASPAGSPAYAGAQPQPAATSPAAAAAAAAGDELPDTPASPPAPPGEEADDGFDDLARRFEALKRAR